MANPPFNVDKVKAESAESAGRLPFGMPAVNKNKEIGNGNYLWISYFYSYLNEHGCAGFVMASSATDSQGKDKDIREKLVKTGHVDAMVKHRPRNDKTLFGGKYPFVQTADVKAAEFYLTEYTDTYNERGLEQSKLWKAGTLCITIAANIADTAILGIDACFPDSIMGFIPYDGVSNVKFVKYAFDILQRDCQKISQGTAQDNLSWKKLSTIKFPAPPIEVQDRIVAILSVYDDLIENNKKQIKLLEEAAQRLYKEWFVDLRFPGYEDTLIVDGVPEGWKKEKLIDIANIQYGFAFDGSLFNTQGKGTPIVRIIHSV